MTNSDLELRKVRKSFPDFDLGPLSLHLSPGRAYGLLGPNGAGKTTLLNLIALQLRLTSGEITFGGIPIQWGDPTWKARFSYIREMPCFYDEFSIEETMWLASRLYDTWDSNFASRLLDRFQLDRKRKIRTLSKGNTVKLGILVGLAHHADLLILDEPTAGLDPTARADLQQLLRELMRQYSRLCLLLSSHIFEDLEHVTDEVMILRKGRLAFTGSQRDLANMTIYRIGGRETLDPTADVRLAWRKNGQDWVMVPKGSVLSQRLGSLAECVEEASGATLAVVYHATEHPWSSDTSGL